LSPNTDALYQAHRRPWWTSRAYDRLKGKLVPGTNSPTLSGEDQGLPYERYLQRIVSDLTSRNVRPVFLLFCGYDGQTQHYDTQGPLQKRFSQFAQAHSIPLLRSEDILRSGEPADNDLDHYFIDSVHMNAIGTAKVAKALAEFLVSRTTEMPNNSSAASTGEMMKLVQP
jgi:hypothetical protein